MTKQTDSGWWIGGIIVEGWQHLLLTIIAWEVIWRLALSLLGSDPLHPVVVAGLIAMASTITWWWSREARDFEVEWLKHAWIRFRKWLGRSRLTRWALGRLPKLAPFRPAEEFGARGWRHSLAGWILPTVYSVIRFGVVLFQHRGLS